MPLLLRITPGGHFGVQINVPEGTRADSLEFDIKAGVYERCRAPLKLKIDGIAAVQDGPYPTDIYTLEYDGYADFPQYPINLISDVNAFYGLDYIHGHYFHEHVYLQKLSGPGSENAPPGSTIESMYIDMFFPTNDCSQTAIAEVYIDNVRVDGKPVTKKIVKTIDPESENPDSPF